jgi:Flp pilus assembly protein TadG
MGVAMMASDRGRQRGIAAVEFALIAPIVFLILFGTVEFGLALWRKQILTTAVREGARKGVVATSPRRSISYIKDEVDKYLTSVGWDDSLGTRTVTGAPCPTAGGTALVVSATYPSSLRVVSRLMPGTFVVDGDGNISLTASVTMQCE